jgi:hypothetical protein
VLRALGFQSTLHRVAIRLEPREERSHVLARVRRVARLRAASLEVRAAGSLDAA